MADLPSISAVVATYNRRDFLPAFLDAVLADDSLDEVVVAVDGSDDGSMELAQRRREHDGRVSPLWVDHRGQFGALDAGARHAHGDIVLLLDDDVIAAPDMCRRHAKHHADGDRLVVLGYMPPELPPQADASWFATRLYSTEYESRCAAYEADPDEVLLHLWGGNASLRRSDFLALDYEPLEPPPGSPPLRMYNQDRDFGLRCRTAGLTGVFDRRIRATHRHRRPVEGFLRDALGQGACEVLLHSLHPDELGPLDPGRFSADLPAPLRVLVERVGVDAPAGRRASSAAEAAIRTAVAVRSDRGAVMAAKLARRIQQRRGADLMSELLRRTGSDPASPGSAPLR